MPLTPSITTSQSIGSPSILNVVDESTGSDVAIVSRRVSLQTASNTYLVPTGNASTQYITWLLANSSIAINALTHDYALYVKVDWLDAGGAVLYTYSLLIATTLYAEQFAFNLCQTESANPALLNDTNYLMNALKLRLQIDNANNAITVGGNIFDAQAALDRANYLIQNANKFF